MHIGIDITSLIYQRGVSRYTANLVRALSKQPKHRLSLFGYSFQQRHMLTKQATQLLSKNSDSVHIKPIPQSIMAQLWKFGLQPVGSSLPGIDVFHSWDWLQPPDTHLPIVSTIHDLAMLKHPETAHPTILARHRQSWEVLTKRQAHIIAVSQATKKDVVELLGYPSYLVHVIHEALPLEFQRVSASLTEERYQQIVQQLQLNRPYILFVGTREPRKNLERLLQAWEPLKQDIDLVIAGSAGWDTTSGEAGEIQNQRARFLGKVSDEQLSVLYGEASVFAYPSLDEGFGLPILEAFHHGTPVVTAQSGGTLEVAGNAAQLIDPESVDSIRAGLQTVLGESTQEQRVRLQRMIVRLHMFTWDKVAQETLAVYQQAIQELTP